MFVAFPKKAPSVNNRKAKLLAESIVQNPILQRIPVIPESGSIINNCFYNVSNKIAEDGGEIVYGWKIWDRQEFWEAEFHSVWRKDEKLLDITPQYVDEILFFEDESITFEGFPVDNIRMNFTGNPVIEDYIKVLEIKYMIENYGENRFLHNALESTILEIPESLVEILQIIENRTIPELSAFIKSGKNQQSRCFCGRDLPYYSCHSEDIKRTYEKILDAFNKSIKQ